MLKYRLFKSVILLIGEIGIRAGVAVKKPIFILGTGRCGTSLLVKIFQSNKKIAVYPTEANELWHPKSFPFSKATIKSPSILVNPGQFTKISINNWPENHEKFIRSIFTGFHLLKGTSRIIVIKSAMISFMIPKILTIFPEAKFIHIYRNGISVAESLFKKEWLKYCDQITGEEVFRSLCANYWKSCIMEVERLSNSLSLISKGVLYELSYEALCNDPKRELIDLSNFIGRDSKDFNFDLSQIKSTNYKVGDYTSEKKWSEILRIIYPLMKKKGYEL